MLLKLLHISDLPNTIIITISIRITFAAMFVVVPVMFLLEVCRVREWLSAFRFLPIPISCNPIPIPIPTPAKHLFPLPLFSHIDIPIHSHSRSRLPKAYIKRLCETIVTTLCSISHAVVVLATQIHDTILTQCVTEDRNKSHYGPLCESCKQSTKYSV